MSKIGKQPILIKEGVEVNIKGRDISVKGPKWELSYTFLEHVDVKINDSQIEVSVKSDEHRKFRGLTRTLISNMLEGVTDWFEKKLLVMWVGFSAKKEWNSLQLALGFSHRITFEVPSLVEFEVEQDAKWNYVITLKSIDKQLLWETASKIRALRKPEPYKWKWIRYIDEVVRLKAGKTAAKKD